MTTITIQIGNSDDKLSQKEWSSYVTAVAAAVTNSANQIHFAGGSGPDAPWQNFAWVVECTTDQQKRLRTYLQLIRIQYSQEGVAFTVGYTEFI